MLRLIKAHIEKIKYKNGSCQKQAAALPAASQFYRSRGRIVIESNRLMRYAAAMPRAFARRVVIALIAHAMVLFKGSSLLTGLASRLRHRFPAAWERTASRCRRVLRSRTANRFARHPVVIRDRPNAWDGTVSQTGHFKEMLSQELRKRQNQKRGHR